MRTRKALIWLFVIVAVIVLALLYFFDGDAAVEEVSYSVSGRLLFDGEPPPVVFAVGLCEVISDGMLCAYSINPPAPRTWPDENGYFEIKDVPPDEWGLIFDFNHILQIMPRWPDKYGEILFTVTDSDVDLGTLDWDNWPCELLGCEVYFPIIIRSH